MALLVPHRTMHFGTIVPIEVKTTAFVEILDGENLRVD